MRSQCLATITKILHFSKPSHLGNELTDLPISSFIAGLLTLKDSTVVAKGMQLAQILMHKLPKVFHKYFLKEGVVHAVEQLAATAPKPVVEDEKKEKARGKAAKRASQRLKVRQPLLCLEAQLTQVSMYWLWAKLLGCSVQIDLDLTHLFLGPASTNACWLWHKL